MRPTLSEHFAFVLALFVLFGIKTELEGKPLGRMHRSADEDIIAGVDFLSVFIRNAEERFYPDPAKSKRSTTTPLPYDVIEHVYDNDKTEEPSSTVTSTGTSFNDDDVGASSTESIPDVITSIGAIKDVDEPATTSEQPLTTIKPSSRYVSDKNRPSSNTDKSRIVLTSTRRPRVKSTTQKIPPTSESPSNIELKTMLPPITNSEVSRYIKSKTNREQGAKHRKEDTFTEISVEIGTDKPNSIFRNSISVVEPSAILANANKDELSIDEEDPLVVEATEINEEIIKEVKNPDGANPDYIAQQHARVNRQDESSYQFNYNGRVNGNKARSISYSTVVQVLPAPEAPRAWKQSETDYDYPDQTEKKNLSESAAETKEYYVTRKFNTDEYNESLDKGLNRRSGENWDQKKFEDEQRKLYHTTEKVWGSTSKIWGSTPKIWGTTEKNWGIPEKSYSEPTGNFQPFQSTPKVWGTTEKNWGIPEKTYSQPTPPQQIYSPGSPYGSPERNYEVDEADSVRSNGRVHGVQSKNGDGVQPLQLKVGNRPEKTEDNQKTGYVVEGRNYKKYRVEERTSDGFIVGEYGVVSNNDGSLRGVRYTADGTIHPSVIYDALMKFLSL